MPDRTRVLLSAPLALMPLFVLGACGGRPRVDASAGAPESSNTSAEAPRPTASEAATAAPAAPTDAASLAKADEALLEAFAQTVSGLELDTAKPPEPVDPSVGLEETAPRFASLQALFEDEGHSLGCEADTCPGLRVLADLTLPPLRPPLPDLPTHRPIGRVLVAGTARSEVCVWWLLLQTEGGWLAPQILGDSPRGCKAPIHRAHPRGGRDAEEPALEETAFFPLDVQVQGSAFRLIAQSVADWSELEASSGEYIPVMDERAWRLEVHLCVNGAFGPGTFGCAREAVPAKAATGTMEPKGAPKAPQRPNTARVDGLLPFTEVPRVGIERAANWHVAPSSSPSGVGAASLREALDGSGAPVRLPIGSTEAGGAGAGTVLANRWGLYLARDGRLRRLSDHQPSVENERFDLMGSAAGPGFARVDLSRTMEGEVEVTWRWSEIVTPRHHIALATGVELRAKGEPIARWERRLQVDEAGVTLRPGAGQLAWFRGVGRFTWDELEQATAKWRLAFARAWEPHRPPPPPAGDARPEANVDETKDVYLSKMRSTPLETLPGFAEPLDWAVVDAVHPLERPSSVGAE